MSVITDPQIEQRNELPYVAIRAVVAMQDVGSKLPALIPRVYGWLQQQGQTPAGPMFFRYIAMDQGKQLDVEIAVPVRGDVSSDGEITAGTMPSGRYAVARYRGSYDGLPRAWSAFEEWREKEGISEEGQVSQDGTVRGTRAEHYVIGPNDNPDPQQWETELVLFLGSGA